MTFITELNDNNFQHFIEKDKLVLVDIWAEWCGPCKTISPIIDQLSVDFQNELSVGKLDVDSNSDIVSELSIRNIPTILFYKNGEIVEKIVGATSKERLEEVIKANL